MFFLAIVAAVAGTLAWREYRAFESAPLFDEGSVIVMVRPGQGLGPVTATLERLKLARPGWHWRVLGRLHQPRIKAGEYRIEAGTSPRRLIDDLTAGKVVRHRFTIIEGWNLSRLRREISKDSRLVQTLGNAADEELMRRLGCEGCFAEGRFLPETYQFLRGDRDLDLLARSYRAMSSELDQAWRRRDPDMGLESPEQLLVLASLVEMETMHDAEREQVAGVFVRRLKLGMRLQTDPTVVYGLSDDFDGRIRLVHLRSDHPWNTYTRHGLPPTPIALPGKASIHAAASPADGDALYFVARGDGSHHFSATLAEHNRAVARYILGKR
ncbi:MAG: endolytic transglycosylase MltG [Wenzhouxiangellaceae bacterium]|nr:endolytic transglycosylase MltG [Wenzhouxiangellaceae bacterium]